MLSALLCGIIAVFKPYTCFGDAMPYMALLLAYRDLAPRMRFLFVSAHLLVFGAALCPLFWHLWIVDGGGNANFFYAGTVVYGMGHVLLIVDALYAHMQQCAVDADPSLRDKRLKLQ